MLTTTLWIFIYIIQTHFLLKSKVSELMFSPEKFTLVSDLLWNPLRILQGFDIGKVLQSLHEQKVDNILSTQYPWSKEINPHTPKTPWNDIIIISTALW